MTIREQIEAAKSAELLTVRQVALLCQLHEQTVYRQAHRGDIPGMVRFGKALRFNKAAILDWKNSASHAHA